MDKYTLKFIKMIKNAKGDSETLEMIIDKIYSDGFQDGLEANQK